MRTRTALVLALVLALAAPAVARADDAPASAHVARCKTGPRPGDRYATFKSWMRAVPGSSRMAVRFRLEVRGPGQTTPQPFEDAELEQWHHSHTGVAKYLYSQTVRHLRSGSSYRVRVQFRWYDSDGHVIQRATRHSGECVEDNALPNLKVTSVSESLGPVSGTSTYGVSVTNNGRGAAAPFSVAVIVDGALADSRTVPGLAPGQSTYVELNGPNCRRFRGVVDRENIVPETVEDDNSLASSC